VFLDTTFAILGGGKASRLGGIDKGSLRLNGVSLRDRLHKLAPLFAETLNVGGPEDAPGRYVPDTEPRRGVPGGILAALGATSTPWLCVVACDMPFIEPAALKLLRQAAADHEVSAFCTDGDLQPLPCWLRTALKERWAPKLHENPSLKSLLSESLLNTVSEATLLSVDAERRTVVSVNTPTDCRRWGVELPDPRRKA
jgi:molybdopterin-guanine dinucleotide biosynthesis protein A